MSHFACVLGWPVGWPTKGYKGLIRGENLHRNSPEAEGTFCSTIKSTSEETNLQRKKIHRIDVITAWAQRCHTTVRGREDHSLAQAVLRRWLAAARCSYLLAHTLNDASPVNGDIERLPAFSISPGKPAKTHLILEQMQLVCADRNRKALEPCAS